MYSELDRTYIRHFLGFAAIFVQADLRLENAITASQSQADGGARPDSNAENFVKGLIYGTVAQTGQAVTPGGVTQNIAFPIPASIGLLAIESQLSQMWSFTFAVEADQEAKIDTARAMAQLRAEGRRLVNSMATMLATSPRRNIFSSTPANPDGDAFYGLPDGLGRGYQW